MRPGLQRHPRGREVLEVGAYARLGRADPRLALDLAGCIDDKNIAGVVAEIDADRYGVGGEGTASHAGRSLHLAFGCVPAKLAHEGRSSSHL